MPLPKPKTFFSNLIANTCEKNIRGIKRYGRHLLSERCLKLMEQGDHYLNECDFGNSFFEKKLVKSKLCKEQYEKWVSDGKFCHDSMDGMWNRVKGVRDYEWSSMASIEVDLFEQLSCLNTIADPFEENKDPFFNYRQ